MKTFPFTVDQVDCVDLPTKCLQLYSKNGQCAVGTFYEVVDGLFYVATADVVRGGTRVRAGTCFVYTEGGTFEPYRSVYRAIRAYLTYARGWAMMQRQMLQGLTALAEACVAKLFGVSTLGEGEFARLNTELAGVIESRGEVFTSKREVQHALAVFNRTRRVTRQGSQLLGYGNSSGVLRRRLSEVLASEQIIVSIGTVLSQYLGAVLGVVAQERAAVHEILGSGTDALVTKETAEALLKMGERLRHTLIVCPMTRVGRRAADDCHNAAQLILAAVKAGQTGGVSEPVRNLLSNVRDSLDLLQWQYDLEQVITIVARPSKDKTGLSEAEWADLEARVEELIVRVESPFGSRFKNLETVPKIRLLMQSAVQKIREQVRLGANNPMEVKSIFVAASDAI